MYVPLIHPVGGIITLLSAVIFFVKFCYVEVLLDICIFTVFNVGFCDWNVSAPSGAPVKQFVPNSVDVSVSELLVFALSGLRIGQKILYIFRLSKIYLLDSFYK